MKNLSKLKFLFIVTFLLSLFSCTNSIFNKNLEKCSFKFSIPISKLNYARAYSREMPTYIVQCSLSGSVDFASKKEVSSYEEDVTFEFDNIPLENELIIKIEVYDMEEKLLFIGKERCIPTEITNTILVNLKRPVPKTISTYLQDENRLVFYEDNIFILFCNFDFTTTFGEYGITNYTIPYIVGSYSGDISKNGTVMLNENKTSKYMVLDEAELDDFINTISSMSKQDAKVEIEKMLMEIILMNDENQITCEINSNTATVQGFEEDFIKQN